MIIQFFFLFVVVWVVLGVKYGFHSGFSSVGSMSPAAVTDLQIPLPIL